MSRCLKLFSFLALIFFFCPPAFAHFQVILPGDSIISHGENRSVYLRLEFTHPFEQILMDMEKPISFGLLARGEKTDFLPLLEKRSTSEGLKSWESAFEIKRPGDHIFYVEPVPYWEPSEGCYIIHYAKTVVNAFGMEEGWDEPVGLRAEIIPLTRPYGLWEGNLFTGRFIVDGKPVGNAYVEVEFYNTDSKVKAPSDPLLTQVTRTDDKGVFSWAIPWAGWWGFAALTEAPERMKSPSGEEAPVELGAVIWVYAEKAR
ncbi:MAG TPA: DUF4198 domain-containing protein [Synergistaceae bacterium]|jgi:cobalt/nickel transport protein|nr:MAG: Nickel transport complex, NikM subunit, transmembrane [Synergistales bacterium 54_9]MDK2846270.1 nickel transport protein [Synergistales bacterium]HAA47823.1 DUF4198 domain-containing protein [Synergistaceae bacterium]